jgi:hypothetical protein
MVCSPNAIFKKFPKNFYGRWTVADIVDRLRNTGPTNGRSRSGRRHSVVTQQVVKKVRSRLLRKPDRSQNKMAKELHVTCQSIGRVVNLKLGQRAFKRRKSQFLSEKNKRDRVTECRALLRRFAPDGSAQYPIFRREIFRAGARVQRSK